jgi:predicted enzyme related to lactoylglutathione lyase
MKLTSLSLVAALALGLAFAAPQDEAAARSRIHAAVGYTGESTLVLQVADLQESLAFYQEKLGFSFVFQAEGMAFAEVMTPTTGLAIGLAQMETPETGGPELTFGVADIEQARKALEKLGVAFDRDTVVYPGLVKLAHFKDPSGNQLILHQALRDAGDK